MPNIASHLHYVGITDVDVGALRSVRPLVEPHTDAFIQYFYKHLQSFDVTRAFIEDPLVLKRLLDAQRRYVLNMFDAHFDDDYYRYRCRIGHTHFRLGLDFKWYLGAYVLYLDFFMPLIETALRDRPEELGRVHSAFQKVTILDMSIVLEAYHKRDKEVLEETTRQMFHKEKLATVGLLVSGLAHEIGNPLASIQAICDNLLYKTLDPHVGEKIRRIRGQVSRIVGIVRELMNYARPVSMAWKKVDLKRVFDSALEIARLSRSAKIVQTSVELAPSLPFIDGIEDHLSQVFVNIFLNAYDAMSNTGGVLSVSATREQDSIVIFVKDNGSGISPDNIKKIYDPFFSTKDVGKGAGLGLHVSMSIIQNHSGSIAVSSTPSQATCFTVRLPIVQKTPATAVQPAVASVKNSR